MTALKVVAPLHFGGKEAVADGLRWFADLIEAGEDTDAMDFRGVTTAFVVVFRPGVGPGLAEFGRELTPWEKSGIFQTCALMALDPDGE